VGFVAEVLDIYGRWFDVVTMREHVKAELSGRSLPALDPDTARRCGAS
jgi:hypothetical protein